MGEGGSHSEDEDAQLMHLAIHHPNLSRILQRRQALRGSSPEMLPRTETGNGGQRGVEYDAGRGNGP